MEVEIVPESKTLQKGRCCSRLYARKLAIAKILALLSDFLQGECRPLRLCPFPFSSVVASCLVMRRSGRSRTSNAIIV